MEKPCRYAHYIVCHVCLNSNNSLLCLFLCYYSNNIVLSYRGGREREQLHTRTKKGRKEGRSPCDYHRMISSYSFLSLRGRQGGRCERGREDGDTSRTEAAAREHNRKGAGGGEMERKERPL